MAKSKITKGINRKIQTKTFEQVDIICQIEEEISWETIEERDKKTKRITDILIDDFKNTYNEVLNTLGVDRCIGSVTVTKQDSTVAKNTNDNSKKQTESVKKENESEINFDF